MYIMLDIILKHPKLSSFFYHVLRLGWLPVDSFCITFFRIRFISKAFINLVYLLILPCSTDSSLTSSTKSSAYYTFRICLHVISMSVNFQQQVK